MVLPSTTRNLQLVKVMKDARTGKTDNLARDAKNRKIRVWSKIFDSTATVVETKRNDRLSRAAR